MARRPASRPKADTKPSLFEPEAAPAAPAPAKAAAKAAKPKAPAAKPTTSAPSAPKVATPKAAPKAFPAPAPRSAPKSAAPRTVAAAPAAKPTPKAKEAAPAPPPVAAKPEPVAPAPAKPAAEKPAVPKAPAPKAPAPKPAKAATPAGEEMSPRLRAMAERNVEQARSAYADYVGATERMLDALDDGSRKAWSGARDVNLRILGFAEANAKAGFDFAERFLKAGDLGELAKLQRDYMRQTTERLSSQMREIQKLTQDATRAAMPKAPGRD